MKNLAILAIAVGAASCGPRPVNTSKTYFVTRAALAELAPSVEVVDTHDSGLIVTPTDEAGEARLDALGPGARMDRYAQEYTRYSFESAERKLKQLADQYPDLAKLETYGTSRGGRPEYVLTIRNRHPGRARQELMITAATHGNEQITVDVVLGLVEKLLAGYGHDERLTLMVDRHVLRFVPMVCVDSYVANTRENEGRDPNRDYPWPEQEQRSPVSAIRDIMAYADSHEIAGSMDYHAAASMIMFPWAYTYDHIPQDDYRKLNALTTRMAEANGFAHGDIASTIYIAPGSSADYYYWKHKTMATAIEVSHNYASSGAHYDDIVEENTESTWRFIESFE